MKIVLFLLAICSMQAARADLLMALGGIVTGVGQVFSTIVTTNCTCVKDFFGLQYSQLNQTNKRPDLSLITMDLYTTNRIVKYSLSQAANLVFADPFFNPALPNTIYVHGFLANSNSTSAKTMTGNLLKRGNSNVLFIDASSVIDNINYLMDSTSVTFIGELLGTQLAALVAKGINPSSIHMIGHSLGAHVCGFAGKTFKSLTGTTVRRISGLDVAGPCFFNNTANLILASTDADFVDVIHTDAGQFGMIKPIGHVDFYPNSGANQPNTLITTTGHSRSWQLFAESLLYETNFLSVKCASWSTFLTGSCTNNEQVSMGIAVPPTTRGIFYLRTGGVSLFGMGVNGTIANPVVDPVSAFFAWWNSLFGISK